MFRVEILLLTLLAGEKPPEKLSSPVERDGWILPAAGSAAKPIWGVKGGIAVGLWPTSGPRGLIRIYAPYLGHPPERMINFIAVEPVVGSSRGLSEIERSKLDGVPGKAMWTTKGVASKDGPTVPWHPAQGRINGDVLTFVVHMEGFDNGAKPVVEVALNRKRPYEVTLRTFAAAGSAVMKSCVLTATMGNYARLRRLQLKDRVVEAPQIYRDARLDGWGFFPHRQWNADRMQREGADLLVSATTDEPDPASNGGANLFPGWRYVGRPATQHWKTKAPARADDVVVRVNARRTYWPDAKGERNPIPGGVSFENFELESPFREGQEFTFGVDPGKPHAGLKP